jgi:hypothetical protein
MSAMSIPAPEKDLSIDELRRLVEAIAATPEQWQDQLDLSGDGRRPWATLHRSEHLDVWAIGWLRPEHDTGFHDHDLSRVAVHVVRGAIRHESLTLAGPPRRTVEPAGTTFSFDRTANHRMAQEPQAGPTVTIHAYSPPLREEGQLIEGEDGLLHRVPRDPEESLGE